MFICEIWLFFYDLGAGVLRLKYDVTINYYFSFFLFPSFRSMQNWLCVCAFQTSRDV